MREVVRSIVSSYLLPFTFSREVSNTESYPFNETLNCRLFCCRSHAVLPFRAHETHSPRCDRIHYCYHRFCNSATQHQLKTLSAKPLRSPSLEDRPHL
jgi:hypothetical protein